MAHDGWPELDLEGWVDTRETLHLWTQVAGKVKLALSPFQNQWWEVGLTLTTRGMTTGPIPWGDGAFSFDFDVLAEEMAIQTTGPDRRSVELRPRSVKDFHATTMQTLADLGIDVEINTLPAEIEGAIRFEDDEEHAAYDGEAVRRWWRACLSVQRVIERYRTPFGGKSSPIILWWGGFDLSHARFTGKAVATKADAPPWFRYGEDAENLSVGFWPGSREAPEAVLYGYGSPAPDGIADAPVRPDGARWEPGMGEFVLPYAAVRSASSPDDAALEFFSSVYEANARLAGWDTEALAAHVPES